MVKRVIVEAANKDERKARRQSLGSLKQLVIKPATLDRYEKAFQRFLKYLSEQQQTISESKVGLDSQLQEYLEWLWEEGEGISCAADTLSAVQHFQPSLKRNINGAWRLFRTWQRFELPARAPPITPQILEILMGYIHQSCPALALGLGVAFKTLLRTGELLALVSRNVVIPPLGYSAVLYLGDTKTASRNPHAGTVTLHDPRLVTLLRAWKLKAKPEEPLVPMSSSQFRLVFKGALEKLKLTQYNFKPYSLRRGGATDLWFTCRSYSQISHVGRWSSERTVKVYIQDSIALLTDLNFEITPAQRYFSDYWKEVSNVFNVEPRHASRNRGRGRRKE